MYFGYILKLCSSKDSSNMHPEVVLIRLSEQSGSNQNNLENDHESV